MVPFFQGTFAWGCRISEGAKFTMTPVPSVPTIIIHDYALISSD